MPPIYEHPQAMDICMFVDHRPCMKMFFVCMYIGVDESLCVYVDFLTFYVWIAGLMKAYVDKLRINMDGHTYTCIDYYGKFGLDVRLDLM